MKTKRARRLFGIAIAILLIYIAGNIWVSSNWLTVNDYEYTTEKAVGEVRMIVISDLHDHRFGKDNEELAKKIQGQTPDLILLDGDIMNEDSADASVPCTLIKRLKEIAPVYFALGNHEMGYMEDHPELIEELEEAGACVLEKEYADIDINGTALRLGGMYDYAFGLNGNNDAEAAPPDIRGFLEEYQETGRLKIMMAHRPDSFIFGNAASYWNLDFVISGHNHGGQVILPVLGGLYGGDQGWIPEYIHGMYQKDHIQLFVTSGLGSHKQILPRFNNPPEIAVVVIKGL